MTSKYHMYNAGVAFVIFSIVYILGLILYWQLFPYRTAEVVVPIQILNENKQVRAGEQIRMRIEFNKQTNVSPTVTRSIICENTTYQVEQPTNGTSRPQGKFTADVAFRLSEDAKAGDHCKFQFQNVYQVNIIRTITKVWESEPFEVIE